MTFHELHHVEGRPLVLPNAWDVASALAYVEAGFPAVGTTSFGVSATEGRPDGRRGTAEGTRRLARRLAALPVHVTADIEDGYHDEPEEVADYAASLGVAGVNLEDSADGRLVAPELPAARIAAVKRRAPGLFVNARVDTYWLGQDAAVEATVARALAYVAAGADGVFVPGAGTAEEVRELARRIPVPLNVLASPTLPVAELGRLGVRRVSTGSLPYRAALDAAVSVAEAVRDGRPLPAATSYHEWQRTLARYHDRDADGG